MRQMFAKGRSAKFANVSFSEAGVPVTVFVRPCPRSAAARKGRGRDGRGRRAKVR